MRKLFKRIGALAIAALVTSILALGATFIAPEESYAKLSVLENSHLRASSGKLVIGDSRAEQIACHGLFIGASKEPSIVAIGAGHYGFGGETFQIDWPERVKTMQSYIKSTLKKKGYCHVYIFPAVYDFTTNSRVANALTNAPVNLAKKLAKVTYNKKKPTVTVLSMIPPKGKNSTNYNKVLKSKVTKASGVKYKSINSYRCGSYGGYSFTPGKDDPKAPKLLLNKATLKKIWNKVIK